MLTILLSYLLLQNLCKISLFRSKNINFKNVSFRISLLPRQILGFSANKIKYGGLATHALRATQRHTRHPDVTQSAKAHLITWQNLHFFVIFNKMTAGSPSPPPQKSDSEHWCCSPVKRTQRKPLQAIRSTIHNKTNMPDCKVSFSRRDFSDIFCAEQIPT